MAIFSHTSVTLQKLPIPLIETNYILLDMLSSFWNRKKKKHRDHSLAELFPHCAICCNPLLPLESCLDCCLCGDLCVCIRVCVHENVWACLCLSLMLCVYALNYILEEEEKKNLSSFNLEKTSCIFQWSCMNVRVGLQRKLSAEELMLLNCSVEDYWESLGLQGDPTSPF